MNHRIDRFCSCEEMGTFGRWLSLVNGDWAMQGFTVEQPWRINTEYPAGVPFHSCIPAGNYQLLPFQSDRWGSTWVFVNEHLGVVARKTSDMEDWYRYACLTHLANWMDDVEGCVGTGRGLSAAIPTGRNSLGVRWMVTHSGDTVRKIKALLSKDEVHSIEIRDVGLTHTFRKEN